MNPSPENISHTRAWRARARRARHSTPHAISVREMHHLLAKYAARSKRTTLPKRMKWALQWEQNGRNEDESKSQNDSLDSLLNEQSIRISRHLLEEQAEKIWGQLEPPHNPRRQISIRFGMRFAAAAKRPAGSRRITRSGTELSHIKTTHFAFVRVTEFVCSVDSRRGSERPVG